MNDFDKDNLQHTKKPNTFLDLLMGLVISAVTYAIIWFVSVGRYPMTISALVDFAILVAFGFLVVKFFRKAHTAAAIIMLVLISPGVLVLLLFGACSLMFSSLK
jgi:hypothetical protein